VQITETKQDIWTMGMFVGLQHLYRPIDAIPIKYVQPVVFELDRYAELAAVRAGHGDFEGIEDLATRQNQHGRDRGRKQFLEPRHPVTFRSSKDTTNAPHPALRAMSLRP
jgi:hypothetical protein